MDLDILYIIKAEYQCYLMRVIMLNFLEKYSTEIVMEVENQLLYFCFEHGFLIYCL